MKSRNKCSMNMSLNIILCLYLSLSFCAFAVDDESSVFDNIALHGEQDDVFDVTETQQGDSEMPTKLLTKDEVDSKEEEVSEHEGYYSKMRIVALNKITANSSILDIDINKTEFFNNIKIEAKKCWKPGMAIYDMSFAFVTITEHKFDDDPRVIFNGWLISNQAALSAFEHPVYEIFAINCLGKKLHEVSETSRNSE